jgi:hypothetical protein
MNVQQRDRLSDRRWIRKLMPVAIVLMIVVSLGTILYRAVEKARNAARSADTT